VIIIAFPYLEKSFDLSRPGIHKPGIPIAPTIAKRQAVHIEGCAFWKVQFIRVQQFP
jgi:hypothetical protein